MLIVELNEYNKPLLSRLCESQPLPNIERILGWKHCVTQTADPASSGFLDPWCQWVSVHTGQTSSRHQLKNLGEVPPLTTQQLWQYWEQRGESSIIWGVMNASRANTEKCIAFIPDPWTFSEDAYPAKYSGLIKLPRYLAKNYVSPSKLRLVRDGLSLIATSLGNSSPANWAYGLSILRRGRKQFGKAHLTSIVLFEYFSAMAFIRAMRKQKPDHGILFLNMLAHAQHHYWTDADPSKSPQLMFAAQIIDHILGKSFETVEKGTHNQNIAVLNAISQKNTSNEPPWFLYVPRSHADFLAAFDIGATHVEPLMTNDAHAFFDSQENASRGERRLKALTLKGKPLLQVERNNRNPKQLFYKGIFTDAVDPQTQLECENSSIPFSNLFSTIVQRTGRHVQNGDLLWDHDLLPPKLSIERVFNQLHDNSSPLRW